MYTRRFLFLGFLASRLLMCQDAQPSVQVAGAVKQALSLTSEDLAKLPRASVKTTSGGMETIYEGVWLHEVLKRAGAPLGSRLRGKALSSYLLAEAQDGYQVVFSLAELDPSFVDNEILLADTMNGKPLSGELGHFRLVVPKDKPAARSVRMLTKLEVVQVRMTPVNTSVQNRLAQIRKSRGVGASDLARRVQVSRQTIYAIEAGTYVPNTEVALNLARELEVTVDELFSLQSGIQKSPESLDTEVLSAEAPTKGQPVRICQIGSRWVSVPVSASPYYMPEADGIIKNTGRRRGRADLLVFAKEEAAQKRLVLAGCDPATGLLARMVERISGFEVVSAAASSKLALTWLVEGKVHIAGSHLEDAKTGEFNLPFLRKQFPGEEFSVVTFARWEEGLVISPGNPKSLHKVEDLGRKNVRFVNREPGSGSRGLLDQLLEKAAMDAHNVQGYDRIAYGHLAAAYCVVSLEADACLATRSAAQTFGLDFIPIHSERYDLVMRKRTADLPAVKAFLDVLQRAALRRKLEVLAGYDTSETGTRVA